MLYCYKVLSWVLKVFKLSLKSFLHFHIHLSVKAETTNIEVYQLCSTLKSDLCGVSCAERSENLQPVSRTLKALWQVQTSAAVKRKKTTTGETWSQNNHSRSAWMRAFWMSLWQACETAVTLSLCHEQSAHDTYSMTYSRYGRAAYILHPLSWSESQTKLKANRSDFCRGAKYEGEEMMNSHFQVNQSINFIFGKS